MMRLRADVTQAKQRAPADLPLDRDEIVFVVRIRVPWRRRGHSGLRQEWRIIDIRIRMMDGRVQRRKRQRKRIDVNRSIGGVDKWRREERLARAGIAQPIGRLRLVDSDRVALNYRIKDSITCADAGLLIGRVGDAKPWRKTVALR